MLLYSVVLFNLVLIVEGPIAGKLSLLLGEIFPFLIMFIVLQKARKPL